jgi:putative ABC transport system permease protein
MALFAGITAFSWAVAIGTLIAGAIGVGNIMLIVVKERTKEIGVRKAIGATSASIVAMVIQEALVITLFAGYWGLVVGVFLLESIAKLLGSGNGGVFANPEINLTTAFLAMAILVVAALLAALLPASKAASVNPIVALQDE